MLLCFAISFIKSGTNIDLLCITGMYKKKKPLLFRLPNNWFYLTTYEASIINVTNFRKTKEKSVMFIPDFRKHF